MFSQWWRRQSGIAITTTRRAQCCSTRIHNTSSSSSFSFWNTTTTTTPPPQRRGRKRGRQNSNHDTNKTEEEGSSSKSTNNNNNNDTSSDVVKTFQSRGWRVLWPNPYNSPRTWKDSYQRLPSTKEIRQAWKDYKSTWAAGLRGDGIVEDEGDDDNNDNNTIMSSTDRIRQNASRNLHLVQTDGQEIMKHFSNKTGIHNSQDLKNFASEMMTLITNCLKEFMIGYRMGRDEEVEKMLHEYFQDDDDKNGNNDDNDNNNLKTKRKRKPKRFHPPR